MAGIEAEQIESWVGSTVVAEDDGKLGKLVDVHYRDGEPVILEITHGLTGRRRYLGVMQGATVSREHIRLAHDDLVQTEGGVNAEQLQELAAHDERLRGIAPDALQSLGERQERQRAHEEAKARAEGLYAELVRAQQQAEASKGAAEAAAADAREATKERERIEKAMNEARAQAEALR